MRSEAYGEQRVLHLLDAMITELKYAAPGVEARRVYLREMPGLVGKIGQLLVCKARSMLDAVFILLHAEISTVASTAPSTGCDGCAVSHRDALEGAESALLLVSSFFAPS